MKPPFRFGIDRLCDEFAKELRGLRVGLVAHAASVSASGIPSPDFLRQRHVNLTCLFGPEHGFSSRGGAGETMADGRHARLGIPVYSLYGETRKPTARMLKNVDVIVFDLHDLGARPYTYVSTLRLILEAAAENGKRVMVADRPAPLANTVDGPMLDPVYESFVGFVRTPVVYGMTPAEMALWLKKNRRLSVDLQGVPMDGWARGRRPRRKWIPPSPAIRSWACGLCFPITVFLEALPGLDHGRGTAAPFQRVGAPWLDAQELARQLTKRPWPGIRFTTGSYRAATGNYRGQIVRGLQLEVLDANAYQPVQTGIAIIDTVQRLHGAGQLWSHAGTREHFFDQLMGTDVVRRALQSGQELPLWNWPTAAFQKSRRAALLYEP